MTVSSEKMQDHTENGAGSAAEESRQLGDTPANVSKSDTAEDHPPAYDDHARDTVVFKRTQPTADKLSKLKGNPTNYLSVNETHRPIKGTYIIDPSMRIPSTYLPPLGEGETEKDRKNLHLHTRDGNVNVDVWLVGHQRHSEMRNGRTTLHASSRDGYIIVKVHAIDAIEPFFLDAFTRDGQIKVLLPRSFHGPVALKSRDGGCKLSDELLQNSTPLGVVDNTTRFLVGGSPAACDSVSQLEGYELKAETRDGSVRVKYVDEDEVERPGSKPGLFSRIFSK